MVGETLIFILAAFVINEQLGITLTKDEQLKKRIVSNPYLYISRIVSGPVMGKEVLEWQQEALTLIVNKNHKGMKVFAERYYKEISLALDIIFKHEELSFSQLRKLEQTLTQELVSKGKTQYRRSRR